MTLLVCLGAGLRLANFGNVTTRTPDERVYTSQANVWLESGQPGLRALVEEYKSDPETRYYPPPTRVGMIRLVAAIMQWTGRHDESAGALVSCAASIGSLCIVALIGLRFLPPWAAVFAALFYAVLPPELVIARRAWTDALTELAGVALLGIACEIAGGSRRVIWYLLFAVVGSVSLAVKESLLVPYGLSAVFVLAVMARHREWKGAITVSVSFAVGLIAILWWMACLVGGLGNLVSIVLGIPGINATNPYALEYASGPRYMVLRAFWIVSPGQAMFGLVGLYVALRGPRELANRSTPIRWMAVFVLAELIVAMSMPHWINLRYLSVIFGPACMLAGLGCWYLVSIARNQLESVGRTWVMGLAMAAIAITAMADYQRFQRFFVRDDTADLSIKMLLDEEGR